MYYTLNLIVKRADEFVAKKSINLIFVMTLASFVLLIIGIPAFEFLASLSLSHRIEEEYTKFEFLILATIIAPLVETFIFQFLVIEIMRKYVKPVFPIIALSAILFALSHLTSYAYAAANLLNGIIFAFTYVIARKKGFNSYLCTATVHSLRNLIVFSLSFLFEV